MELEAAFSTDEGGKVSAAWTHRNLFGNAEMLTLGVAVTQLKDGKAGITSFIRRVHGPAAGQSIDRDRRPVENVQRASVINYHVSLARTVRECVVVAPRPQRASA